MNNQPEITAFKRAFAKNKLTSYRSLALADVAKEYENQCKWFRLDQFMWFYCTFVPIFPNRPCVCQLFVVN